MAIIQDAMQDPGAMTPGQMPEAMPPQPTDAGAAPGGSADQGEAIYRRLGLAAMKVMYTKPESDELMNMLEAGKDNPVQTVAQAAMAVIARLERSIDGIDPQLAYSVAAPIVVFLLEMADRAGIFETDMDMIPAALEELATMTGGQAAPAAPAPGVVNSYQNS